MLDKNKLIVSHAPFLHVGSSITERSFHILFAALPAVFFGLIQYGIPVLAVISLSISSAMLWELAMNYATKRPVTICDGNAALIGLLFAMLLPATAPWWFVITGTFIAVVIGKQIFGGIGGNSFNPVALAFAIIMVSWKDYLNFDGMLLNYDFGFSPYYPLAMLKNFGPSAVESISLLDLFLGKQTGGLGATCGLALLGGGVYLSIRGFIRWEIALSFLAGVFVTALLFQVSDPARFAGPGIHLLAGYTMIGAFFLATEDSSSPVNMIPMFLYGLAGGILTVLIRNIGAYVDGVILAILLINLINPLLDKIRPKAMGKVV